MKIHSDHLDILEVRKAATVAGVDFTRLGHKGSRSREFAFDVILTGSSPRRQNGGEDPAATWDEWGIFLAALFTVDPDMVTTYYESAEHFHWSTGGRFLPGNLRPSTQCTRRAGHKWEWTGQAMTGSYSVHECSCGAIRRFLTYGGTFAEFVYATN